MTERDGREKQLEYIGKMIKLDEEIKSGKRGDNKLKEIKLKDYQRYSGRLENLGNRLEELVKTDKMLVEMQLWQQGE